MDSSTHTQQKEENRQTILRQWDTLTEQHTHLLAELAEQLSAVPPERVQERGRE